MTKRWRWIAPAVAVVAVAAITVPVTAAASGPAGCPTGVLVAQHVVAGSMVGETQCSILSQTQVVEGDQTWEQTDIGFDGTVAGYADPVTVGNTRKDVTDVPNILFPQFGIASWVKATGTYSGTAPVASNPSSNTGLSVIYPADRRDWNGKAVFVMHGQSNDTPVGTIPSTPFDQPVPDKTFSNLFAYQWMKLGYAVIYVRRPASSGVPSVLADGQHLDESINDNIAFGLDMLASGRRYLATVLGRGPSQTLGYGHSAGTIWLRELNYSGLNTVHGQHLIAGLFSDDPGGGLPLPLSMPMGQLLGENGPTPTFPQSALLPASIVAQMVPEITLAHQLYQAYHTWDPTVRYTDFKLEAPVIYHAEHVDGVTRTYELAGVSHISNQVGSPPMTLDYGGTAEAIMVLLQRWVDHQATPAANMVNKPGQDITARQLLIPPTACPTGIRFPWPPPNGAPSETGYVAYGSGLEPVNSQGMFVDVSRLGDLSGGDGVRDALPSMAAVWAARHLPTSLGQVTTADMVSCVNANTATLVHEGLLTTSARAAYLAQAAQFPTKIYW